MSNPILMMTGQPVIRTAKTNHLGGRNRRRERLKHRSSDRTDAILVPFDDLDETFRLAYPWEIRVTTSRFATELTLLLHWCADNFGVSDYFMPYVKADGIGRSTGRGNRTRNVLMTTRMRWNHIGWTFYFKTQEDATLFRVMKT